MLQNTEHREEQRQTKITGRPFALHTDYRVGSLIYFRSYHLNHFMFCFPPCIKKLLVSKVYISLTTYINLFIPNDNPMWSIE